jgi:hypothetical protein
MTATRTSPLPKLAGFASVVARAPSGREFALRFRIADRSGRTVRGFDVEHTKRMHFIAVRRNPLTLREAGRYRLILQFKTDGRVHTEEVAS